MSGTVAALTTLGSGAFQALSATNAMPAFIRNQRKIGTIIPDVTVEEQHSDRIAITQHPIADGTPISDHAYLMPPTLTMRVGWTNANPIGATVQGGLEGLASSFMETRARDVYDSLRALQTSFEPFQVTTGKRTYENMMIAELSVRTDHTLEYSLIIECNMQQVFRVATRTTQQPSMSNQAIGSKTASPVDEPQQQPVDKGTIAHQITGLSAPRQVTVTPPGGH